MKTLLVTTGNGMFGRAAIEALAGNPNVKVRAMVRALDSFDFQADNVEPVVGDMDDPASLRPLMAGVTDVFMVSPMDEHIATREINVVDAAKAVNVDIRVLKLHGAVNHRGDHLSSLHEKSLQHLKSTGLAWTLICPNSVMETSFLGFTPMIQQGSIYGTSGHGSVGFVALRDVGEATAVVVESGSFVGESVMLTGGQALDMFQVVEVFSEVLGKQLEYVDMPDDDYAQMLIGVGVFPDRATVDMQILCHYEAWRRGDAALVSDDFRKVTGHDQTTLNQWIESHRDHFLPTNP